MKKQTQPNFNDMIQRAIRDLQIDVPILHARLVGNRLELYLYGGRILTWPDRPPQAETPPADPQTSDLRPLTSGERP